MGAKIVGIEYVHGSVKVTNDDLGREFNYDFSKFEKKVGIKNRYVVKENQTAIDLAILASEKLLKKFDREKIDYVIYCTQSPEYFLPTTACILQEKLKLRRDIGAFDYNLGCSGYVYGLSLAKGLIYSGQAKSILLITAETYSKYLHPKDRSNRSIFGDAATATIIEFNDDESLGNFCFGTDGSGWDKLIVKNGCIGRPFDFSAQDIHYGTDNIYSDNHLYMDGPAVFNFTQDVIPKFIEDVLIKNSIKKESVDQFVLHQANAFALSQIRKILKINAEKFYVDLEDGGNTVSNTIPIALKKYTNSKEFNDKESIILTGFGVGLSWCGVLIYIDKQL